MMEQTTIAAIATPHGTGGLSVIRVSGPEALPVCDACFAHPGGRQLADAKTHTLTHGYIVDAAGSPIDEVLCAVLRAPRSFTGEDTVEVSCHGGLVVTRAVLARLLQAGAVLAGPGEFSKRAFLNGKLDLSQAEAVIDVINAKSELALTAATHQLKGALSGRICRVRDGLLDLAARLGVLADFPEEDIEDLDAADAAQILRAAQSELSVLHDSAHAGRLLRDGIDTVIVGKPNVGKSSLLNALLGEERAIVTEVAGTTRDVLCEQVDMGGFSLNVYDTAGLHESGDYIENLGMDKARAYLRQAELVLLVVDGTAGLDAADEAVAALAADKRVLVLCNKADVADRVDRKTLARWLPDAPVIEISAKTGQGLDKVRDAIRALFDLGAIERDPSAILTNVRHAQAVADALVHVRHALDAAEGGLPLDLVSVDVLSAARSLGEVTGQSVSDEVVDRIFHQFCVGK